MSKISFVYFDVGGVVIQDLVANANGWEMMKRDLGLPEALDQQFDAYYDQVELEVQAGKDLDSYLPEMTEKFGIIFPAHYSMITDFVKRFRRNESLWPVIKNIQKNAKIGLLTNMYPHLLNRIRVAKLLPPAEWDVIIDSSVEKMQKPERRIYELATSRSRCAKSEILFVDDREKNLIPARAAGWQGFLFDSTNPAKSSQELANFLGLSGQ